MIGGKCVGVKLNGEWRLRLRRRTYLWNLKACVRQLKYRCLTCKPFVRRLARFSVCGIKRMCCEGEGAERTLLASVIPRRGIMGAR